MDMSDEKEPFDDTKCPYQPASMECDDRVCSTNQWSCGDGQCISDPAKYLVIRWTVFLCTNRRDQFFQCELVDEEMLRTEEKGRCTETNPYANTSSISNHCIRLFLCAKSKSNTIHCPCSQHHGGCAQLYRELCPFEWIAYPAGGLITPYTFQYYRVTHTPFNASLITVLNGTIKCPGYMVTFTQYHSDPEVWWSMSFMEFLACTHDKTSSTVEAGGYSSPCRDDTRTFNNRTYRWIKVPVILNECISVYRFRNGFYTPDDRVGEDESNQLASIACSNVHHHRFQCSTQKVTCLVASALINIPTECRNTQNKFARAVQSAISATPCNKHSTADCYAARQWLAVSWNHTLYNSTDLSKSRLKKIPFRSYCDTFQDAISNEDEDATLCQSSWTCSPDEWQCHTGQCIDYEWVLDKEWDCPDGSDEDNIFAVNFNESHPNYKWLQLNASIPKFVEKRIQVAIEEFCIKPMDNECARSSMLLLSNNSELLVSNNSSARHPDECIADYDEQYVAHSASESTSRSAEPTSVHR